MAAGDSFVLTGPIWDELCRLAGIRGRSPHSARHGMGNKLQKKTGNIAAVQRQLGHKNATYSMQYSRPSFDEMEEAINEDD